MNEGRRQKATCWRGLAVRADYIRQNGTGCKPAPAESIKVTLNNKQQTTN
jgi:hypothetical protein